MYTPQGHHKFFNLCCSVLQCVALCCCVLLCVAVSRGVLQCVAVCCSVWQCVAECRSCTSLFHHRDFHWFFFPEMRRILEKMFCQISTLPIWQNVFPKDCAHVGKKYLFCFFPRCWFFFPEMRRILWKDVLSNRFLRMVRWNTHTYTITLTHTHTCRIGSDGWYV